MVARSTCAGVGDDAGDQCNDIDLAANQNSARQTYRQDASSDDPIDLMKDFSLSSAQAIGGAWQTPPYIAPAATFDERYGQW